MEKRVAPVDIAKWMRLPVGEMPDWVLCTIMLDHPVSPAEADLLNKDDEFWPEIEALDASLREGTDECHSICRGLIDYVQRLEART